MANDPICVRQAPYAPAPSLPPADHRGIAPARDVAPGGPGHNTAPQPAARQPKLRVPDQAKDRKAAEEQAETTSRALKEAKANQRKLIAQKATPEQISAAEQAIDIAQAKAERSAMENLNVRRESNEHRSDILRQAKDEAKMLRKDRSPSAAEVSAALDHVKRASEEVAKSRQSLDKAMEILDEVAGVRPDPSTDAATKQYPNLVIAQGKFYRASDRLSFGERKDIRRHIAEVQKAAKEFVTAWEVARKDPRTGSDTKLRAACDVGFARARENFKYVTDPKWVKSQESP